MLLLKDFSAVLHIIPLLILVLLTGLNLALFWVNEVKPNKTEKVFLVECLIFSLLLTIPVCYGYYFAKFDLLEAFKIPYIIALYSGYFGVYCLTLKQDKRLRDSLAKYVSPIFWHVDYFALFFFVGLASFTCIYMPWECCYQSF